MRPGRLLATLFALGLAVALAPDPVRGTPGPDGEPRDGAPVPIGTFRSLRSEVLGEDRLLLVSLPEDYEAGERSYPVLYVLYADQVRGYFAEAVHVVDRLSGEGSMPPTIVVGVANVDRYRDLSPVARQGRPSGIEPFCRFVEEELFPFVEGRYWTKRHRTLVGPQAGAEFALYALARRPHLFDAFLIENPFRFPPAEDPLMPMMEERLRAGVASPKYLHVTCADRAGGREQSAGLEQARRFERRVAELHPRDLMLVTRYVEESPDFLPPLRLAEGLRGLYRDYPFPAEREVRGLADLTGHYAAVSRRLGFEVDVPERVLAAQADALSGRGGREAAREILEHLVRVNPASLDGYWRLANLWREAGEREKALASYRKCVELMPNMGPAHDWIRKLEEQR